MSGHRRNNLTSSLTPAPQSMSGAEMLVLQQSIKQYILARQTRELTEHELEELEKLRNRLLPSLQRYSQSHSQLTSSQSSPAMPLGGGGGGSSLLLHRSGTADISKRAASVSSSQQGRLSISQQQQQQQQQQLERPTGRSTTKTPVSYPTTTSSGWSVSTATQKQQPTPAPPSITSSHSIPTTVASKSVRSPLGNRVISQNTGSAVLQPAMSTNITAAAPNTSRVPLVATKAAPNKSEKKRPKGFAVYQDKENENAPSKRRRLKGQAGHESDSDKENRDPLAATASAAIATPRKTNVLGEKTNFIKNALNTRVGTMKGKEALRNIVASKIVDMAAAAPLALPKTAKSTQQQQEQQRQQKQTRLYPSSTPAATKAPVAKPNSHRRVIQDDEPTTVESQSRDSVVEKSTTKDAPEQGVSHGRLLLNVKPEPVDVVKLEPATTVEWPVEARSPVQQEIVRVPETPPRDTATVPETPPRKSAGTSQQIPGSVEDEDSTGSFERYVKSEHADKKLASRKQSTDYYEIPCSEASQDSIGSASLEETCPMPEFLLEGLPEDPHHDEAEVTLVDDVNSKQLNHRVPVATFGSPANSTRTVLQSSRRNSTLESTSFADGLWCIEDVKYGIVGTVCGFQDQWLAMETTSHVQFWKLDNDTPSVKSQWVRHINLPKASSRPPQVLFAPDDSFAVVMDASECSFTKVPLQDLDYSQQSDVALPTYAWTGVNPLPGCKGFIVEQYSTDGHLIVVAAEEAGSIGFISVPDDGGETDGREMLQAKSTTVPGAEGSASSIALVGNTSLVAATFESTVAIWDVNSLQEPVSVVYTSGLSLINPQLVYAAVPVQFFEQEKVLGVNRSLPATWPILSVFRDNTKTNQCALYAMKGGHVERIHQYQGSSSISTACASSRFIACQIKANGKDVLQLWDISKPEPLIQLSLLEPPSFAEVATQRNTQQQSLWHQQVTSATKQEENETGCGDDLDDIFSSVSTLSPPPEDLSTPPLPSIDTEPEAALPLSVPLPEERTPSPVRRRPIVNVDVRRRSQSQSQSGRVSRAPTEWIDLTSIAIMERKEVSFSIHPSQQWIAVVQKSSMVKSPSVVHILDLMSILYPSSTTSSP